MTCPICGAEVENGTKFCPACGAAIPQPQPEPTQPNNDAHKFCPNCGAPNDVGSAFCPNCGRPLNAGTGNPQGGFNNMGQQFGANFPPQRPGYVPYRNVGLYLILTLVTCGIFGIYWIICLVNDLNVAADTPTDTSGVTVFLLSLVTCGIYMWFWIYKAGDKVSYIRRKSGQYDSGNNGIIYVILAILGFGIIDYCLIQNEINNVAYRNQ